MNCGESGGGGCWSAQILTRTWPWNRRWLGRASVRGDGRRGAAEGKGGQVRKRSAAGVCAEGEVKSRRKGLSEGLRKGSEGGRRGGGAPNPRATVGGAAPLEGPQNRGKEGDLGQVGPP